MPLHDELAFRRVMLSSPEGLRLISQAMAADAPSRIWPRIVGWALLVILGIVLPFGAIAWGRAQRSASTPAVIEQVWDQGNGRVTVGAFSFTVDGRGYRGQDEDTPTARRGSRTWSRDELVGMQVCFDPEHPGEDFALAPARYRCGNPEVLTSDGGW